MSVRRSVSGPAFVLTAGRILAFGASFFIPVVLARRFSTAEFGTYKQIFILYDTLYFIAQAGLATSLFYFLPRAPRDSARYLANTALAIGTIGVVCAGIVAIDGRLVAWLFSNGDLARLVGPGAIYFLFLMIAVPLEIVMICRERYRLASASYAISDILRAAALIVPAIVTRDLRWLMIGAVCFASVRFAASIYYWRRTYGPELRPDRALLTEQLRYSLPFGLAVLVGTLQANFHHFVVSHSFDAATFAIFAVGCLQIPLIDFIATPMADVMMVKMTEARRDGAVARARALWHQAASDLALLFFPLVGLLLVVADRMIVVLFTESYAASVPIFRVSVLTIFFSPLLIESVLRVHADTRFILLLNSLQLGVIAVLIGPLLSRFGLIGGVLVMVAAVSVVRVVGLLRLRHLMDTGVADLLPWPRLARILAIAAGASLISAVVNSLITGPDLLALAIVGTVHVLVWGCLAWRMDFLPIPSPSTLWARLRRFGGPSLGSERAK
jgi:O-antigen/teichoic acid export membrane protein